MNASSRRLELLRQYLAAWPKLNSFRIIENLDSRAKEFSTGAPGADPLDSFWRPLEVKTPPEELESIYAKLPTRFPPLYEDLILNYRWPEVDLRLYTLLGNPPGTDLSRLLSAVLSRDGFMNPFLLRNGYIPFAKGPGGDYDPLCFDLKSRRKNRELGIVKLDHEEILSNERIRVVAKVADSFEELVRKTIAAAEQT
jgi:hypothetical protein